MPAAFPNMGGPDMKRIPLKAAAAATFFAVVVSFLTLASAGAQG